MPAVTDVTGKYTFNGLKAGAYRMQYVAPTGWGRTTSKAFYDVTLATGGSSASDNFGLTQAVLISGTVFNDANGNAKKDSTETGIAGWKVFLDANGNGTLDLGEAFATTDSSGNWSFKSFLANTAYLVRVQQQSGYKLTTPTAGSYSITLTAGGTSTGKLFGEKKG